MPMNTPQTHCWVNTAGVEPLPLYEALKDEKPSVLLESTRRGKNGRFSYIALDPEFIIKSRGDCVWINDHRYRGDPLSIIQKIISVDTSPRPEGFPLFYGGAIGYIGYDLKNKIEPKLRTTAQQDTNF